MPTCLTERRSSLSWDQKTVVRYEFIDTPDVVLFRRNNQIVLIHGFSIPSIMFKVTVM